MKYMFEIKENHNKSSECEPCPNCHPLQNAIYNKETSDEEEITHDSPPEEVKEMIKIARQALKDINN